MELFLLIIVWIFCNINISRGYINFSKKEEEEEEEEEYL
jgi:hypothetical protein